MFSYNENMKNTEEKVRKFMLDRGWDKQQPDHIAKSISIEAAELLELFQWSNPTAQEIKKNESMLTELKGEIADIMIYCTQMTLLLGLNSDTIVSEKLILAGKKYPAELMRKRSEGQSLAHESYLEIKKNYRNKKK